MQLSAGVNSTDGNNICGGSILDNRFVRPKPGPAGRKDAAL